MRSDGATLVEGRRLSCAASPQQDRLRACTGARGRYRVHSTAAPKGLRTRFRLALLGRNPSVPCQGSIYQKTALLEPLVYCPERSDGATLVEGRRLSCVASLRQDRLRACTGREAVIACIARRPQKDCVQDFGLLCLAEIRPFLARGPPHQCILRALRLLLYIKTLALASKACVFM